MAIAKKKSKAKTAKQVAKTKKVHKKVPGFDAFAKNPPQLKKRKGKKVKTVEVSEVIEPTGGIHSVEWVQAIQEQKECGFLKLPYEVRIKIYRHAINDFTFFSSTQIEPRKKGKKFTSYLWKDPAGDTERLYMICRQTYVDLVGSGLLYQMIPFKFSSPQTMLNYLLVIHPVHRDAIRNIIVDINLIHVPKSFHPLALSTLSSMTNLRYLEVQIIIAKRLFDRFIATAQGPYWNPARYTYGLNEKVIERLMKSVDPATLVEDEEDVKRWKSLETFVVFWAPEWMNMELVDGEAEKLESVAEAWRAAMMSVKSA
ncbi:uncharacterized protein LY89DRAFT_728840 [Mollisia scopiformis]|uniref:Uncharacterized protein n=1 Tax=Mollisia scopiformis TaxID=149040 RepID=A0A194XRE4_MOLSC|nr:uncharacterized protein LY89DRAFT_728840 [Mollisia scopiformis]KUJ22721.1 hypothetical protein LY89DRAFT_728840 [Mollisia scopiformis]